MDVILSRTMNMLVFHFERRIAFAVSLEGVVETSFKGYIFWPAPTCNYTEIRFFFSKRRRFRMVADQLAECDVCLHPRDSGSLSQLPPHSEPPPASENFLLTNSKKQKPP